MSISLLLPMLQFSIVIVIVIVIGCAGQGGRKLSGAGVQQSGLHRRTLRWISIFVLVTPMLVIVIVVVVGIIADRGGNGGGNPSRHSGV